MPSGLDPDMLTVGPLNDISRVRHGFFTRRGGISEGSFASLNCGFGSNDDTTKVAENRARAMARIDLGRNGLVTAYQVHSAEVAVVEEPWGRGPAPRVDGLVTRRPGIALGVLAADCVPVLLADAGARVIGAAHAGWRGALSGIIEAVVEAMVGLGARRENIVAGIGPAIGQRSYEVGPEFPAPFLEHDKNNGELFYPSRREGRFLFDLKGHVARRLAVAEVGQVQSLPCDTCAQPDLFFSYRRACLRGEKAYGRNLSAIYLRP